MKLLVYGIDRYTELVISSVKEVHTIIAVTDSDSCINCFGKYKFITSDKLDKLEFDYVIITSRDRGVRDEILNKIIKFNIDKERIISFFEIFHEEKLDKVMKRIPDKIYDGIILGLSHAAKGINPKYLIGNWVNLASSAQDLFHHYEVIKKIHSLYYENFKRLNYLILDLYDWFNFSYDVTLSQQALSYWADGGNATLHNYNRNCFFSNNIENAYSGNLSNYPGYYSYRSLNELKIRNIIFNEKYVYENIGKYFFDLDPAHIGYDDFPCELQNYGHIDKIPLIPATALLRQNRDSTRYTDTEQENKNVFYDMMNFIKSKWPGIKIILTLLPRYDMVERIHKNDPYIVSEKNKFLQYITDFVDNKDVLFVNFKNQTQISKNHYLWRDVSHLNYQGGIAMTSLYNSYL